jgi:hypothetical protein
VGYKTIRKTTIFVGFFNAISRFFQVVDNEGESEGDSRIKPHPSEVARRGGAKVSFG